jgi:hypothetical protein
MSEERTAAVRLEGGLGDHILGMRLLRFIHERYPEHTIIVYSDSAGCAAQLEIVSMSPLVSKAVPVFKEPMRVKLRTLGELNSLPTKCLEQMYSADVFFDGEISSLFLEQARQLGVSHYDILASRPGLRIPAAAHERATELMSETDGNCFLAINLAKFGVDGLRRRLPLLRRFLDLVLKYPGLAVLNIFAKRHDFPHWPEPERTRRREAGIAEAEVLEGLSNAYQSRILSVADEPVQVIAALLSRCRYFIGVDNGIKHLAWALRVPLTFISTWPPDPMFVLKYYPDYHRMVLLDDGSETLTSLLSEIRASLCADSVESGAF